MYYIHKYEIAQQYGGPEEGGWWYKMGEPVKDWKLVMIEDEETAYEVCRALNFHESDRAKNEEDYEYTSVLSYKSQHFEYDLSESPIAEHFPATRPHYE
jgi:hypothetical protein